jgi:hypothetical protein
MSEKEKNLTGCGLLSKVISNFPQNKEKYLQNSGFWNGPISLFLFRQNSV